MIRHQCSKSNRHQASFWYCFILYNPGSYIMLLKKTKRTNPPCGNLYCVHREDCFPPPNCVKHAAEMKAELRSKATKGTHVGRTRQSLMHCIPSVIPLWLMWYRWCWWQEVTRCERRIIIWHHAVCHHAGWRVWLTCCWHILSVLSNLPRCNASIRGKITTQADKETQEVVLSLCQLSPFCFLSCLRFVALIWTLGRSQITGLEAESWRGTSEKEPELHGDAPKSQNAKSEVFEFDSKSWLNALRYKAHGDLLAFLDILLSIKYILFSS